ncbi:hypothetical protein MN116_002750 [Schistosoma mekongi]|uniref:Uncharacterized protein n=1 Tax=Schistosoma mekongi TaxID=38744 RepID=A0AAE1ZH24_SCHME|nr:hypothetical protein MN116_002750 [Schistosoma mekongi]
MINLFHDHINAMNTFKKFTCLILPIIDYFKHVKFTSFHQKSIFIKENDMKQWNWLCTALRLGLTILQVCNGNKFWTRFQYTQSINTTVCNQSEKLHLTTFTNSYNSLEKTNYSNGILKRCLLLFEKFGVGKLKMLPISTGYTTNPGSSYSVLFIWIPYEIEQSNLTEYHKINAKLFFYSVTLHSKGNDCINEEQLVNQSEVERKLANEAITITKSLTQQLTLLGGLNRSIQKKNSNNRDVALSQSKMIRSKTYTSGINPPQCTIYTNTVLPTTNPILRKSNEDKYENDANNLLEDNQTQQKRMKQVTSNKTVKFGPVEELGKKVGMKTSSGLSHPTTLQTSPISISEASTSTPIIISSSTTTITITETSAIPMDPLENITDVLKDQNNEKLFFELKEECASQEGKEALLTKSTSCPNQLAQHTLNNPTRPTSLFEKYSDYQHYQNYDIDQKYEQIPLSATVLLAIPEVGENDYHADSPQCLTAKELKELGFYNSEDEEDEDDDQNKDGDYKDKNEYEVNEKEENVYEVDNILSDERTSSPCFNSENVVLFPTVSDFAEMHIPQNISPTNHEGIIIS